MNLSFHRSRTMSFHLKQKPGKVRAFVFDVGIGLTKQPDMVDPESGMLVSLVKVDALLAQLKGFLSGPQWPDFGKVLEESLNLLRTSLAADEGIVQELRFREKRGFAFGWRQQSFMSLEETLELEGDLYRVEATSSFNEDALAQKLIVKSKLELFSESSFSANPGLLEIQIEHLATGQKTHLRNK
jgi:hypothetical protein